MTNQLQLLTLDRYSGFIMPKLLTIKHLRKVGFDKTLERTMKLRFRLRAIGILIGLSMATLVTPALADKATFHQAKPLHGHNALLNTPDNGDDQTAVSGPELTALCRSFVGKPNPYAALPPT